jgi:hypothetical protein
MNKKELITFALIIAAVIALLAWCEGGHAPKCGPDNQGGIICQ